MAQRSAPKTVRGHAPVKGVMRILWEIASLGLLARVRYWLSGDAARAGREVRKMLEGFEGLWPEFARILARRTDLFPTELCAELGEVEPAVPETTFDQVKAIVEQDLKKPILETFRDFTEHPEHVGWFAQVHRALLRNPDVEVAVKIQSPVAVELIARDLKVLKFAGKLSRSLHLLHGVNWSDVLWELEQSSLARVDLRYEASGRRRLRKSLRKHKIYVPYVFVNFTSRRVIVSEHLAAPTLEQVEQVRRADPVRAEAWLAANNISLKRAAKRLIGSAFRQLCEDNLFHDDLSPEHVLVLRDGRLAVVGNGIPGSFDRQFVAVFQSALRALGNRDLDKFADMLFLMCDSLPVIDLSAAKRSIIRTARTYLARASLLHASHGEKTIMALAADTSRVLFANRITASWQLMGVLEFLRRLDASLALLHPQLDYPKALGGYLQKAASRHLSGLAGGGVGHTIGRALQSASEMVMFQMASLRRQAQVFQGATGKVAYFYSMVMNLLSRAVLVSVIAGIWIFLNHHHENWVAPFAGHWLAEAAKEFEYYPYEAWLAALVTLAYLYRALRRMAAKLAESEAPLPRR